MKSSSSQIDQRRRNIVSVSRSVLNKFYNLTARVILYYFTAINVDEVLKLQRFIHAELHRQLYIIIAYTQPNLQCFYNFKAPASANDFNLLVLL